MPWAAAVYTWRVTVGRSWQAMLAIAVTGGLLGAVALGALAGARRTASAYGRYLVAIKESDALVNVPGILPGMPADRPMELISRLPGISAAGAASAWRPTRFRTVTSKTRSRPTP
jgi:hypothetical protein